MLAYSYVRFSSQKQAKGDSIRRQIELRDAYISRNKLTLDTCLTLADHGVSAFRGKNADTGALGVFLAACRAGKVKKGSVLIVENLDRVSRQDPDKAVRLFLDILDHVTIVTLSPEKEFKKPVDMTSFILAVIELCRANGEWSERRKQLASGKKISKKVPSWINPETWTADEKKADVIRRIFRLIRDGYGYQAIAKILNMEKVKPISKSKFWHCSYLEKLMHSPSLKGEYQPRMLSEDGKRVEVGDMVKDYFPVVISHDLWSAAHQALAARRTQRGRISPKVSNLFTDIAYMNDEKLCYRPRNHVGYLTNARQDAMPLRYSFFETAMLIWLKEANVTMGEATNFDALTHKKEDLTKRIKLLSARIATDPNLDTLLDTLSALKQDLVQTEKGLELAIVPSQAQILHGKELISTLATCDEQEKESIRRALKQTVRMVIERIDVSCEGKLWAGKAVSCLVTFKDGKKRCVYYKTKGGKLEQVGVELNVPGVSNFATLSLITENLRCGNLYQADNTKERRKQEILAMHAGGIQLGTIASKFGVNRTTVYKWLHR
jgi:DNA invertase Pin-like site-specific DNA recombinase